MNDAPDDAHDSRGAAPVAAASAALAGLAWWYLGEHAPDQGSYAALAAGLAVFATVAAATLQFAWTASHPGRLGALAIACGAVYGATATWVWAQAGSVEALFDADTGRRPAFLLAASLSLYALAPFVQTYQRSGAFRFPYTDLFRHAWTNLFIGALGMLYVAVVSLVLALWAALFDAIGIDFFEDLFSERLFLSSVLPGVFGYGVSRGVAAARIVDAGRTAALAVTRLLLPVVIGVVCLFLGSLPFTGLEPLWDTRTATSVLLSMTVVVLVFTNGALEDASQPAPYATALRRVLGAGLLALPVLAVLAIYALRLRIGPYGLTPDRIYALVSASVVLAFALGYATAGLWPRGGWLAQVPRVNVWLAPVLIAVPLLLSSPLLDPLRWSARSQVARLASGSVEADAFDYGFLRFRLGHAGEAALAELESLTQHPEHATILEGIARAREQTAYTGELGPGVSLHSSLEPIGALAMVPEQLVGALTGGEYAWVHRACRSLRCLVFAIDLDADGVDEYCVQAGDNVYQFPCFRRAGDNRFEAAGDLRTAGFTPVGGGVAAGIEAGDVEAIPSRWSDVRIADQVFRLHPR